MKAHSFRDVHVLGTWEKDAQDSFKGKNPDCQPLRSGHLIPFSSLESAMLKITTWDQKDDSVWSLGRQVYLLS